MKESDQLIADALRDIAADAGLPRPVAEAAWRAGRRRRLAALTAAPGPASQPAPPARLVSITLSPATPARPDVLAAAARLLRQRAADLHLPYTQAHISGPDVVLTGPAADQTQLETLAGAGVLNLRQVLLSQSSMVRGAAGAAK